MECINVAVAEISMLKSPPEPFVELRVQFVTHVVVVKLWLPVPICVSPCLTVIVLLPPLFDDMYNTTFDTLYAEKADVFNVIFEK